MFLSHPRSGVWACCQGAVVIGRRGIIPPLLRPACSGTGRPSGATFCPPAFFLFLPAPWPVRLTSIKLSGFKSFAEPTNFMLPGQLVGVVGPNGCGKSNIMDAVRWVLGESENRLSDTRENLTRVEDILRELNANLEKLEKQAEVAAKYNTLQADATLKQHQLWFLKRAEAEEQQNKVRLDGLQAVNDLESRMADLRAVESDLETIRQAHYAAGDQVNQAQGKLYEATAEVGKLEAEIRYVIEGRQRVEQRLVTLAEQIAQWQARKEQADIELENLAGAGVDAEERAEMLAAQQRSFDEQSRQLDARFERLRTDRNALAAPDEARLTNLREQLEEAQEIAETTEARLHELQESVPQLDDDRRARQQAVNTESARQADLPARMEALKAMQEKVKTDGKLRPWLAKHGLDGLQGLWSRIHIEPGWENALEAALRERLAALEVGRLDMVRGFLGSGGNDAPPARLAFYSAPAAGHPETSSPHARLSDLLRLNDAGLRAVLVDWLQGCYTAPTLDDALARRSTLQPGEVVFVPTRREATETQSRAHELQVETLRLTQLAEQTRARSQQIDGDLAEVEAQLADLQERRVAAEARFEELDMQLADSQEREAQLGDKVIEAERKLTACREQQRTLERQAQEATFSQRSLEARRGELNRSIETATQQAKALADEERRARDELARLSDAAAQGGLQAALEVKMEREKALGAQRSEYDDLTTKLRASDERRMQLERALYPLRARITEFQLKEQAARLGLEQYTTLLTDAQADLEAVAQSITEGNVRVGGLQSEIDRLHREIAALGAVNLAALDELKLASERKIFLDAQTADLTEAMNTLEDAIRKIDGETRQLLSGTFDTVNGHFGRMFPELFGGGQAKLIITGDEILDSGVQVMAQPPGKKNQTIHLLSGGEKALTAIALVFAIFPLNPAPFCRLDEMDAPLDDANTERYAKLVSSMSKGTQFLFISHNKIAMEMAEQLIGVTMQEQGVSRIVAVDMESALSMADA